MNTIEYFDLYYYYTSIGFGYIEAYNICEGVYKEKTGKHKYINYQTFKRMKSRYLAKRKKG